MPAIEYELKDRIAFITINHTERLNALTPELVQELGKTWVRFRDDESALVAIISGAGESAFCVGYDISGEGPPPLSEIKSTPLIAPTTHQIWKPIIAAIKGYCLGGGFWIAQESDLRVAAEDAKFSIPEAKWNLLPTFGGYLHQNLMPGPALELLLIGDEIDAKRAYQMGFLNRVVPRDQVMSAATKLAERLCANGPIGVRKAKELFYKGRTLRREQAVELYYQLWLETTQTDDTLEGIRAFREKREPKFKGK